MSAWASAASRSDVTMTPLPAARPSAFTTCGAPSSSNAASTSARLAARTARPVGTPAASMIRFANAFEPSSCAAALPGPNTGMPRSRTASATPATSGASGPMTTRSMRFSLAKIVTAAGSFTSRATSCASCPMPALPGAAKISCSASSARSARMMACSRAPEPRTRIFTRSSLPTRPAGFRRGRLGGSLLGHRRHRIGEEVRGRRAEFDAYVEAWPARSRPTTAAPP